ncbi:MAG: glycosyltransferase [Desulfobacteraceae bacterium]|nr:glycosyltransferase [Desulfobacteraceae bacterium]
MKTSVIITTYNRPNALAKVLEGLRCQTRPADEVIIADDGSGHETFEMLRRITADFPMSFSHVWHEDKGFRAAKIRNKAIQKSSGEYIILLDGDCIPTKYFIEDHLGLAEKGFFFQGKRALISKKLANNFTWEYTKDTLKMLKYVLLQDISNSHHLIRLPCFPALSSTKMSGIRSCNMGFFREDIFAVNGFNQDFTGWGREDSELAARFYGYGLKRKEHPFMAVCFHLWHEENNRERLAINDSLLKETIKSNGYVCSNGLVQKK